MRLRSNCTNHKRTTHRALRLALAMALVGGPSAARAVDELPPACTAPLDFPGHAEAGLLPYPFESACRASQAKQTEKAQRLVRLVGLQHASSAAAQGATASQSVQPALPSIQLEPMTPSVVAASATAAEDASPCCSEASSKSGQPKVEPLADSLSESLIDIVIPMDVEQAASTTAARAPDGRMPELVQVSKSMSIAKPVSSGPSVCLNFSDSPTAESANSQAAESSNEPTGASSAGDRSASLHLSSASQIPLKTSPVAVPLPQGAPGMQVHVEGEPAAVAAAQTVSGSDRDLPAAPLPSLEKKVKASLASRTIQLPDRESLALVEKHGQKVGQPGDTLSVRLQESQALSAEYPITELSVEHPTICQLMQTGERSVSLIGMRPGSTRIALITVNGDGARQVKIHQVSVGTSTPTELSLPDLAKEISRTVTKMVPHSDVEIVAYTDYLLVHGFTPYESDAKKILSLVRKTSLVPVVDQLKTNER